MTQEAPAIQPSLNQQQVNALKMAALNKFHQEYGAFMNSINSYPSHPKCKENAFFFFDTAFNWFEKALQNMPIAIAPQPEAPQESAQSQEETTTPEETQAPLDAA